jgi:hypothetical protein
MPTRACCSSISSVSPADPRHPLFPGLRQSREYGTSSRSRGRVEWANYATEPGQGNQAPGESMLQMLPLPRSAISAMNALAIREYTRPDSQPRTEPRLRERHDTVVIGGGQAGLAMSAVLQQRGREHVVLERRQVRRTLADRTPGVAPLPVPELVTRTAGLRVLRRRPERLRAVARDLGVIEDFDLLPALADEAQARGERRISPRKRDCIDPMPTTTAPKRSSGPTSASLLARLALPSRSHTGLIGQQPWRRVRRRSTHRPLNTARPMSCAA